MGTGCHRYIFMLLALWILYITVAESKDLPYGFCNKKNPHLYHQHPQDCASFVNCYKPERPLVSRCKLGLFFDEKKQVCNLRHLVTCQQHKVFAPRPHQQVHKGFDQVTGLIDRILSDLPQYAPRIRFFVQKFLKASELAAAGLKGHKRPFRFVQALLGNRPVCQRMEHSALHQIAFLTKIQARFGLSKSDMLFLIRRLGRLPQLIKPNLIPVREDMDLNVLTAKDDMCPFPEIKENKCNVHARFRSLDGSCNNLKNAIWGRSMIPFERELEADYDDGFNAPRNRSVTGRKLPNVRKVSLNLLPDLRQKSSFLTVMHMSFGQLVDHDIGRTAITKMRGNETTEELVDLECGDDGCSNEGIENAACTPIQIPRGDPDFSGRENCIMFVRSQAILNSKCTTGPREQVNQVTSYIDASFVYGSSLKQANSVRDFSFPLSGALRTQPNENPKFKPLLPQTVNEDCRNFTEDQRCFLAGDGRVNEQIPLVALTVLFVRNHNQMVNRFAQLNPHWSAERRYEEVRRITAAMVQHIVFNEYLPVTLGPQLSKRFGLQLQKSGFFNGYDPSVRIDITNSFQTAAFRFGHSQVPNDFDIKDQSFQLTRKLKYSEVFNRPAEVYNNNSIAGAAVDGIILGQISQPTGASDAFFAEQVTVKLFSENPPNEPGMDLPSLNMHRGRDHGLPGYLKYRKLCGLSVAKSFSELPDISPHFRRILSEVYDDVADIDLFAGGIVENSVPGALMGPTFGCLVARQFRKLRVADRFWYERQDPLIGFTPDQLREIRKATLARLMCDHMDKVDTIQPFVLLQPFRTALRNLRDTGVGDPYTLATIYKGETNERRPCSRIPKMNIAPWIEPPPIKYYKGPAHLHKIPEYPRGTQ